MGQLVEQEGIVAWLAEQVGRINREAGRGAKQVGKLQQLPPVSCFACTAPKACCQSVVVARFYEGVVVAAKLRAEHRDTDALRARLAEAAAAMEAASPYEWRVPCVFLDERERCTVYDARPTACGTLYVYSPAAWCSEPDRAIQAYVAPDEHAAATAIEEPFRERLALRKKVGRRYLGVLPRMVLLALETWDRVDFRDHLRAQPWPSDAEAARWNRRE